METDAYKTKDIGEAAALYSSNIKLLRLDNGDNFYWFVFESNNAETIANSYWSGELILKAKVYYDSLRTLKERVFSRGISISKEANL